jgi:cytidyltransferase-like protein
MVFHRRAQARGPKVALLPGTFNPPTLAHQALLDAALDVVDEAVVVLPQNLPHKSFDGASLDQRLQMLERLTTGRPYSIAVANHGLFIDMSEEFQRDAGPVPDLYIVVGRDAAERILTWNYDDATTIARMFDRFHLLVAGRQGEFEPPAEYRHRIHALNVDAAHDAISSTLVRDRIRSGDAAWRHLVPEGVAPLAEAIYRNVL